MILSLEQNSLTEKKTFKTWQAVFIKAEYTKVSVYGQSGYRDPPFFIHLRDTFYPDNLIPGVSVSGQKRKVI